MATLHSDLFLDGDTAERDDPASVTTITGVSRDTARPEKSHRT